MKNNTRAYIVTLVIITGFTVLSILGMMSGNQSFLPATAFIGLSPLGDSGDKSTDIPWSQYFTGHDKIEVVEEVIDSHTLDRFIGVYVRGIMNRDRIRELTPLDKKEVRLILEDMGLNNTTRLEEVLSMEIDEYAIEQVEAILEENLFDRDLKRLNIILGLEQR